MKADEGPSTAHSWNPPEEAEIDATRGRTAETAANAAAIGTRAHDITGMQPRWSSAQHKRRIRRHMGGNAADTTASATGEGGATPATATAPLSRGRGARDIKARDRPESAYNSRKNTNNKPGPNQGHTKRQFEPTNARLQRCVPRQRPEHASAMRTHSGARLQQTRR